MKKRVAIIGVGGYAISAYIPAFAYVKNAELVALMSKDPKDVAEWSEKTHVPGYTNAEEMMDKEKLDIVILAVYHNQYMPLIKAAVKRDIHILKEKPYFDMQETKEIAKLMKHAKVKMQIGTQRRFSKDYQRFAELVSHMKDTHFFSVEYTKYFMEDRGWRGDIRIAGGGTLSNLGYHAIDILLWNFGLPVRISAESNYYTKKPGKYDIERTISLLVKYKSGLDGNIIVSEVLPETEHYRIFGSEEIVEFDNKIVRRLKPSGEVITEENLATPKVQVVAAQIDYFCDVIDGKAKPIATPEEHLSHMAFVTAAYESEKQGKYIDPHIYL